MFILRCQSIKWPRTMDLDLSRISPNASPPVCKIIDYKKFLYEQKRKQKEIKVKTGQSCFKGNKIWTEYR